MYAWDVPQGQWQVRYEMEGYETAASEWLDVPPPQLDVNMGMVATSAPRVESVTASAEGVYVCFDQYMKEDALADDGIAVTVGDAVTPGSVKALDVEEGLTKQFLFAYNDALTAGGKIKVKVAAAENYAGRMSAVYEDDGLEVTVMPTGIAVPEDASVTAHKSATLTCALVPAGAAAGQGVAVATSDEAILGVPSQVTVAEDGSISIPVEAGIVGQAEISLAVSGTPLTTRFCVTVGDKTNSTDIAGNARVTVDFESNGGTDVASVELPSGTRVSAPDSPRKKGHLFAGWFANEELTEQYDFSQPVTSPMTLYAKWSKRGKVSIAEAEVSAIVAQVYIGSALTPEPQVSYDGIVLVKGEDYLLSYENNVKVGTAHLRITGTGPYFEGERTESFQITGSPSSDSSAAGSSATEDAVHDGDRGSATEQATEPIATSAPQGDNAATNEVKSSPTADKSTRVGDVLSAGKGANRLFYKVKKSATKKTSGTVYLASTATPKKLKSLKVPAKVAVGGKTYRVIGIEFKAFAGCAKLKSVIVGSNVKVIGAKAFYGCKKLEKATLGVRVAKIGKRAFYKCKMLKKLTLKTAKLKAKKVGAGAFGKTSKKITVKCGKKLAAYKKWLSKKGVSKKGKFKR